MNTTYSLLFAAILCACSTETNVENEQPQSEAHIISAAGQASAIKVDTTRTSILERINAQSANEEALVIHMLVPLCDNENQGIVPVNAQLGNGRNLSTNLYWGAGYGVRTFFNKSKKWVNIGRQQVNDTILQRLVFKHFQKNIYLIADAYAGDKMHACLTDYFNEISGASQLTYYSDLDDSRTHTTTPNLLVFNGHNGLMDVVVDLVANRDSISKDAIAIACVSGDYFKSHLKAAGGYPLLMTTNLLAPEAYVVHDAINAWIEKKSPEEIRKTAGQAYHNYQKCGIKGATNLFETGW